jgi:hypothetical protein
MIIRLLTYQPARRQMAKVKVHPNRKHRFFFNQAWYVRESFAMRPRKKAIETAKRAFDNAFCAGLTMHQAVEEAIKNYNTFQYQLGHRREL